VGVRIVNSSDSSLGDPLALENQVCFALTIAARNVVALYRPVLAPLGLTHPQYLVMLALWQYAPVSVNGAGHPAGTGLRNPLPAAQTPGSSGAGCAGSATRTTNGGSW